MADVTGEYPGEKKVARINIMLSRFSVRGFGLHAVAETLKVWLVP